MTTDAMTLARVADALEALRQELARLSARVAALEVVAPAAGRALAPATADQAAPRPAAEGLSDELVLVISAAIAAFLGKKPHIRQIRLLGSPAWLHQGRITIQASHAR